MSFPAFDDAAVSYRIADPGAEPALLLAPRGFEQGYAYPLLALLHDDGHDERQWEALLPELSDRNYLAVAPRAPLAPDGGRRWGSDTDGAADAAARVAEGFHVNRTRVFALGVGGGAAHALALAARRTDLFAGAVAINPRGPVGNVGAGWRRRSPAGFLVLHGRLSPHAHEAHAWAERLHWSGHRVQHLAFPVGDTAGAGMLRTANRWLMERVLARALDQESSAKAPKP